MMLVKADIPKNKYCKGINRHDLQGLIKEFVESENKSVRVDVEEGEYKNFQSLYVSVFMAAQRSGYAVKVHRVNNELYIKKL